MRTALEGLKSWRDSRRVMTDAHLGIYIDTWTFDRSVEDIQKRAEKVGIDLKRIEEVGDVETAVQVHSWRKIAFVRSYFKFFPTSHTT